MQGCACDIGGHFYSLSTDPNPNWSSYCPGQPETQEYWRALTTKYGLWPHIVFDSLVTGAVWDEARQLYRITVDDAVKGGKREVEAEVFVRAAGMFLAPTYPKDLPGLETFKGDVVHTAAWRKDVELRGKRVGVIGNGSSA